MSARLPKLWLRSTGPRILPRRMTFWTRKMAYAAFALAATGCVWIDDFDKFKAMGERDASLLPSQHDAAVKDAAANEDSGSTGDAAQKTGKCAGVDCSRLDAPCKHGVCNASTGACETQNAKDGDSCFDS